MNDQTLLRRQFLALAAYAALAGRAAMAADLPPGTSKKTVCVLGATGMVGNLAVQQLLAAGMRVVAVSRDTDKLAKIAQTYAGTGRIETMQGSVGSDADAAKLKESLAAKFGPLNGAVASLSSPSVDGPMRILDTPTDSLRKAFEANFFTHVIAAKALIPALADGGVYVGINGGLANIPTAGMAQLSTTQGALHSLYEVLAVEAQKPKAPDASRRFVREVELFGLVYDGNNAKIPPEMRIDGAAIGQRIAEAIDQPSRFPDLVLPVKAKAFL